MLLDRRGDGGVLALQLRVFAAHQALQFRELADHLGGEIGLGEARRALEGAAAWLDEDGRFFGINASLPLAGDIPPIT